MDRIASLVAICLIFAWNLLICASETSDCDVLRTLYLETGNDTTWVHRWNVSEANCSTWDGVDVVDGRVRSLILPGYGLVGSIPTVIGNLTALNTLVLSYNELDGEIPEKLWQLTELTVLNVADCGLSGSISSNISSLQSLRNLSLSLNNLSGIIPNELPRLPALRYLAIQDNSFSGSLPEDWWNMITIEVISFSAAYSQQWTISSNISNWQSLESLYFAGVTGSLPTAIFQLRNLTNLTLKGRIHGSLSGLQNASSLQSLVVSGGVNFTGSISSSICLLKNLSHLDLVSNALYGQVPDCFPNLQRLEALNLGHNNLGGRLNLSIPRLTAVDVSANQFNDILFASGQSEFSYVYVSNNNFSSTFPEFPRSRILVANDARMQSTLRDAMISIGRSSAFYVDFSNNSLEGSFDDPYLIQDQQKGVITSLNTLEVLLLRNIGLDGILPQNLFIALFPSVSVLDISQNEYLHGPLPDSLLLTGSGRPRTVDITGCSFSGPASQLKFSTNQTDYYDGFHCPRIIFAPGVNVIGLTPKYYNYSVCKCSTGYSGVPPSCNPMRRIEKDLAVAFGSTLAVIFLSICIKYARKYYVRAYNTVAMKGAIHRGQTWRPTEEHATLRSVLPARLVSSEKWLMDESKLQYGKELYSNRSRSRIVRMVYVADRGVAVAKTFQESWDDLSDQDRQTFTREVDTHIALFHPNIVNIFGYIKKPKFSIIMEFLHLGSLREVLRDRPSQLTDRFKAALEIALGMRHLHRHNIVHCDLKSLNVCVDDMVVCRIVDFGLARNVNDEADEDGNGTAQWMAPELFGKHGELSLEQRKPCDVYSYGIVIWELLTGRFPYFESLRDIPIPDGQSERSKLFGPPVMRGERPPMEAIESSTAEIRHKEEMVRLMTDCWSDDPARRPTFQDIVLRLEALSNSDRIDSPPSPTREVLLHLRTPSTTGNGDDANENTPLLLRRVCDDFGISEDDLP